MEQVRVDQLEPEAREAFARLSDENALLRASVAELRARVVELEQAAETDPLTGLPNRRRFIRELDRAVSQANRHGTPAALLSIDLVGLRALNAERGHLAGDAALIHVARLLQGLIRGGDFAARTGGDEFALVLSHLDADSAIDTAERIARCVADHPAELGGAPVALEARIGVAMILKGDDSEGAIRRAAASMERREEY